MKKILIMMLFYPAIIFSQEKISLNRVISLENGGVYQDGDELFIIEALYTHYDDPKLIGYKKSKVYFKDALKKAKGSFLRFGDNKVVVDGNFPFKEGKKIFNREYDLPGFLNDRAMFFKEREAEGEKKKIYTAKIDTHYTLNITESSDFSLNSIELLDKEGSSLFNFEYEGLTSCAGIIGNTLYVAGVQWSNGGILTELFIFKIQ